jgi:hypothetical protein
VDRSDALMLVLVAGCAGGAGPDGFQARPADLLIWAPTASNGPYGDPESAVNGVRGGGRWAGSVDVFALGHAADEGLIVGFDPPVIDGDGPDLAVFENPFDVRGGGGRFFDPVVVEVSADCDTFVEFPHTCEPGGWTADPTAFPGFAGLTPVHLHEEDNPVDPLSDDAGGDRFDLADLGDDAPAEVACVRLTSASAWLDPDGVPCPHDPVSTGPDIDGVYGRADVR